MSHTRAVPAFEWNPVNCVHTGSPGRERWSWASVSENANLHLGVDSKAHTKVRSFRRQTGGQRHHGIVTTALPRNPQLDYAVK